MAGTVPACQVPGTVPGAGCRVPGTVSACQVPGTVPGCRVPGTVPACQVPGTVPGAWCRVPGTVSACQVPGTVPGAGCRMGAMDELLAGAADPAVTPGTAPRDQAPRTVHLYKGCRAHQNRAVSADTLGGLLFPRDEKLPEDIEANAAALDGASLLIEAEVDPPIHACVIDIVRDGLHRRVTGRGGSADGSTRAVRTRRACCRGRSGMCLCLRNSSVESDAV